MPLDRWHQDDWKGRGRLSNQIEDSAGAAARSGVEGPLVGAATSENDGLRQNACVARTASAGAHTRRRGSITDYGLISALRSAFRVRSCGARSNLIDYCTNIVELWCRVRDRVVWSRGLGGLTALVCVDHEGSSIALAHVGSWAVRVNRLGRKSRGCVYRIRD